MFLCMYESNYLSLKWMHSATLPINTTIFPLFKNCVNTFIIQTKSMGFYLVNCCTCGSNISKMLIFIIKILRFWKRTLLQSSIVKIECSRLKFRICAILDLFTLPSKFLRFQPQPNFPKPQKGYFRAFRKYFNII